jgi:UDP-N-acetylmuramoyl-L-alanyl-D-glutamate--2,6-diaminopimelate ligase
MNIEKMYPSLKDINITGITSSSNLVKPGYIFVALVGQTTDGHKYIQNAIENGAALIVQSQAKPCSIPVINVQDTSLELARLSQIFYNTDLENINYIGITGTDGKTTTAIITKQLLNNSGYIGTNGIEFSNTKIQPKLTTPIANDLHAYFAQMINAGSKNIVMEVSSHARVLLRDAFVNYKVAAFTNLSHDHLDFHSTIEEYFAAKETLFKQLNENQFAVINNDDAFGRKINTKAKIISYAIENDANLMAKDIKFNATGTTFILFYNNQDYKINSPLVGQFNVYNLLCAIGICLSLDVSLQELILNISSIKVPEGRFELVKAGQNYMAVVDFAHAPNAIEKILKTAQTLTNGKIIAITGSAGKRDKIKRPEMGKLCLTLATHTIFTTDDPYDEDPNQIIEDMLKGNEEFINYTKVIDRRQAIAQAIKMANEGDVILLLGRGHEKYIPYENHKIEFLDSKVFKEEIEKSMNV